MRSFSWPHVHHVRLARNHLLDPSPGTRTAVVAGDVCGIQAQVLSAAKLCLGLRTAETTEKYIEEELWQRRSIVKTYGMRSTLHLFPSDELSLWMAAMRAPRMREGAWYEAHGLDESQANALIDALSDALDGRCLMRAELAEAVAARAGSWAGDRLAAPWSDLLDFAAYAGILCYGPSQGSNVTYVRMDQWTGRSNDMEPETAVKEVLRRYLTAYGPAAPRDFAQWFRMKPRRARLLMQSLGDEVEEVEIEGARAWMMAADPYDNVEPSKDSLRLLPQYDSYIIGCRQRAHFVIEQARRRIAGFGRGRFEGPVALPLLLIDGMVVGIWQRKLRRERLDLKVEPSISLTRSHLRQLDEQAARLGDFYGVASGISIGALG